MLWSDRYRIGVPELDGQHMIIFSIFGQIEAALEAGVSPAVAHDILRGLRDFAQFHLRHEEVLMEHRAYPQVYDHAIEHQKVMEEVELLLEDGTLAALPRACSLVAAWFADHILSEDKKFAEFLLSESKQ